MPCIRSILNCLVKALHLLLDQVCVPDRHRHFRDRLRCLRCCTDFQRAHRRPCYRRYRVGRYLLWSIGHHRLHRASCEKASLYWGKVLLLEYPQPLLTSFSSSEPCMVLLRLLDRSLVVPSRTASAGGGAVSPLSAQRCDAQPGQKILTKSSSLHQSPVRRGHVGRHLLLLPVSQ